MPDPNDPNAIQIGGKHYQRGIQHWDYVLSKNIPYLEASAMKYIERHTLKNGYADLKKAKHYIDKMMAHYYPDEVAKEAAEAGPGYVSQEGGQ